MKLQFTETIEREVELTVPCYRKDDFWVVKIISEKEFIQVNIIRENGGENEYHITHSTVSPYSNRIAEFFHKNFSEATEEEFENLFLETKRRLLADVNAQIFQQEKAA